MPVAIAAQQVARKLGMPLLTPTLRTRRHIIKGSDGKRPYLGFNQLHTLRELRRLNVVPVVRSRVPADGRVLVEDRVDISADCYYQPRGTDSLRGGQDRGARMRRECCLSVIPALIATAVAQRASALCGGW